MRQLRISRQPSDSCWATDQAQTQPLVQRLVADHPLPLAAATREQLLRYLVAVARQYRRPGASWESLLAAGYAGAAHCLRHSPDPERWLAWWVRQKIIQAEQSP